MLTPSDNHVADPDHRLSRSSSSSTHRADRKHSLRLTSRAVDVPIPPSLLQSPYLNSPQSIFQREVSMPRHPNAEDEQWLQDTVPLLLDDADERPKQSRSCYSSSPFSPGPVDDHSSRGWSPDARSLLTANALSSPPLIYLRNPPTATQNKAQSAPCFPSALERGYFSGTS